MASHESIADSIPVSSLSSGKSLKSPGSSSSGSRREREAQYASLASDPKYKKYSQQVEKCLTTFENMQEWPDFIAFLKQLLKTLQSYPQFKDIPRRLIVAKRLSQCLNPALPSGVHQRALDVYAHILSVLGTDGLANDLQLWSLGLFPFFEYASTSVRPMLLNLFETRYLPLQENLRPVMKSFILALLPGLEEETGEYFDKVLSLLDQCSGTVSPSYFLQNVWLIMLTATVQRAYAINYLSRRLPRLDTEDDITPIVGRDIGLMIRAFAAALEDDNLLVRRGALDLLIQCLPLHGGAVKKQASQEDRVILMRAAISVVLRRDLSLNRRLYTWLLGNEEGASGEKQMGYLKMNGLELLRFTLRTEMFYPSSDYSNSRPFKIFISLLDKWEIGSLLTEALVYDALASIRKIVLNKEDEGGDLLITANALYEAAEPSIVWKQLYKAVRQEVLTEEANDQNGNSAADLLIFVLKTFRLQDDEVQKLHLPLVYSAIIDSLKHIVSNHSSKFFNTSIRTAMMLAKELQRHISLPLIVNALKIDNLDEACSFDDIACHIYGIEKEPRLSATINIVSTPLLGAILNILEFIRILIDLILSHTETSENKEAWNAFTGGMQLLLDVSSLLGGYNLEPITIAWSPQEWLKRLVKVLSISGCSFAAIDRVITAAVNMSSLDAIQPRISIEDRSVMLELVTPLLAYLSPTRSVYHVRAVDLIYSLEGATKHRYIESIIANSLTSSTSLTAEIAYMRFGVLWRLTDDKLQPGFTFKIPMLIVLESLRSNDPQTRRTGETWMRSNLRSYTRVLDPLLYELLDPTIQREEHTFNMKGRQLRGFIYQRPFDHNRITYLFEILGLVAQFGGQTFNRIASTTPLKQASSNALLDRISKDQKIAGEITYMDVLIDILLRFLQSEPKTSTMQTMSRMNIAIHSTAIDLFQNIVSKGELDTTVIETLEAIVIGKLFLMIHTVQLDLQNKLLHLLHSIISSLAASRARRPVSSNNAGPSSPDILSDGKIIQDAPLAPAVNPFLVQAIIDGIATSSNRSLLQQWLDFVLMTASQFPQIMVSALPLLATCICRQLSLALREISDISQFQAPFEDLISSVDDAELVMLLNALENVVLLSLPIGTSNNSTDENTNEKASSENSGLLNLVSNVFSGDTSSSASESRSLIRNYGNRSLQEAISILYSVWVTTTKRHDTVVLDLKMSLSFILNRTHSRCCRVFERLFRAQSLEVVEAIIDCWYKEYQDTVKGECGFQIIDFLTASAQNVVHLICESITMRIAPTVDKNRRVIVNPRLTDNVLFVFLEGYLERLEGPLAVQVWSRYNALAKEVAANLRDYRLQVFAVTRCLTVLVDKISQTPAIDDRKLRRDIQDVFGKLLDACVLIAGRSFDQGLWIRRNTKEVLNINGSDLAISKAISETKLDEKSDTESPQPLDSKLSSGPDLIDQINQFLATKALPNMRTYIGDNDKIATACTQITYYIINPALRAKTSRPFDVEDTVLRIIEEMSRMPAAVKAWRNPVVDAFNDNKIFALPLNIGQKWMGSVKALFTIDKSAFSELLGKITSTPSANIFANREYEMLMRAFNVRRMSYVILAAEKNQFLAQLPAVQEKLVDLLRNVNSPVVESEVYTCVRVLLCRLSPHNLASFWPVLLTELYRVFEQALLNPPSDASEDLLPILAASKLLDLLLVLQSEEFQIHQWMFITDTVDAIYPPDQWFPEALMDQLAEVISDLPATKVKKTTSEEVEQASSLIPATPVPGSPSGERSMRRPLLRRMKQIDSIRDLLPFLSHISVMSYESVYASGGAIDWQTVERGLLDDMFDGR